MVFCSSEDNINRVFLVGAQMAAKQEALAELQAKVESAEVAGDENSSRINDMQVRLVWRSCTCARLLTWCPQLEIPWTKMS